MASNGELTTRLIVGDCVDIMAQLPENSVDTCITDPPYDLTSGKRGGTGEASLNEDSPAGRSRIGTGGGFMGKQWDATGVAFKVATWVMVYRVLKPGGMLFAFGGTRTHHRLMCAIEDAGFEIRDCMMLFWVYGSGFPKSLDISKAIDKAAGAERAVTRQGVVKRDGYGEDWDTGSSESRPRYDSPATDAARTWDGYGTALKPAYEPIIVAMKPLDGTFAENAQKWGVAGLAIDAGRIEGPKGDGVWGTSNATTDPDRKFNASPTMHEYRSQQHPKGRWPANLLLDEEAAAMLDEQSGERKAGGKVNGTEPSHTGQNGIYGTFGRVENKPHDDSGGASRFFYVAKASRAERDAGLEGMPLRELKTHGESNPDDSGDSHNTTGQKPAIARNHHPTVKPVALMEYLCKLTRTPTGGTVIDPFMGSGTTGVACVNTRRSFIGIDMEPDYIEIAMKRISHAEKERDAQFPLFDDGVVKKGKRRGKQR